MIDAYAWLIGLLLVAWCLTGGADLGAGVWDLLARGPRAADQRRLIEHAIAPIWEANHIWLILVVVLLFSVFPTAFAAVGTALHIPLTIALLGIVLRGMQALVVDGIARELGPMEGYVLPGHVEHSAYCGPAGATVIDIFCPVREDYRQRWEGSSADSG